MKIEVGRRLQKNGFHAASRQVGLLLPMSRLNKDHNLEAYEGWAAAARTPDKEIFLAYFEKGCPTSQVRRAKLWSEYRADWFDPRSGTWQPVDKGSLRSDEIGIITLPASLR